MKIHPLANLFPDMTKDDFATLVADIKENGLLEPISTYQDSIIDGKHRFKACDVAKIEPQFFEYTGDDPLGYVISKNLSRRHLEMRDRALIAAELANLANGSNQWTEGAPGGAPISETKAAKIMNVSRRSVQRARKILGDGSAKLVAEVRAGKIPLSYAAAIAELKKRDQSNPKKRQAAIKKARTKRDPNKEAPLNSHAWVCANMALRRKWIDDVGVKDIWKAMTNAHREQLEKVIEEEEAEDQRSQPWQ